MMKIFAPIVLLSVVADARWRNQRCKPRFRRPDGQELGEMTVEFDGRGGQIKIYNSDTGLTGGYIMIRQKGLQEIDETGLKIESNWNLERDYEWADFDEPVLSSDQGKDRTNWYTSFGAVEFPETFRRQFFLEVFVTETEETVTPKMAACYNCTTCDDGGQLGVGVCGGCRVTESHADYIPPSGYDLGVCAQRKFKRGTDEIDPNGQCVGDTTSCTREQLIVEGSITFNVQIAAWDFASTTSTLRYTVLVRSREGGRESRRGKKRRNRLGKWGTPIELDGGDLVFPEFAQFKPFDDSAPSFDLPVTISNTKTDTKSFVHVDFDYFAADGYILYQGITMNTYPTVGAASATVPAVAMLCALYAMLY